MIARAPRERRRHKLGDDHAVGDRAASRMKDVV